MEFNQNQKLALEKMRQWKKEPNSPFFILSGVSGAGKLQPNSERVLTPSGWVMMGEIRPGDFVIGSNGKPTKVTDIFPQGIKDVYRVTFSDGSCVRCGLEHLWEVQTNKDQFPTKKGSPPKFRVLTTGEMIDMGVKTNAKANRFTVRAFSGLQDGLSVDYGYALGQILGDGCLSLGCLQLTCDQRNADKILTELTKTLGTPISRTTAPNSNSHHFRWSWRDVPPEIQKYRKAGKSGVRELIDSDQDWLTWDYESRLSLLQGLMDSDGHIGHNKSGHQKYSFTSTNLYLVELVRDLVRSLGGSCKEPILDSRDKYSTGYCGTVSINGSLPLFRWREQVSTGRYSPNNTITAIDFLEYQEESTCIMVDADDHLYVTEGFKLTHNTSVLKEFIKEIPMGKLVITAPTTEALENIAEDLPQYSAMTCHKLLGYRPTETCDEKQILVRAGARKNGAGVWVDPPPKVVNYEYVILEEAYYNPGVMIDSIFDNYRHIKWIFLGDYKQLSPVDENESRLLQYEDRVDFKHDLPEDMRSTCEKQKNLVALTRAHGLRTDFTPYVIPKVKALRNIMSIYDGDPASFSFLALAYEHRVVDKVAADIRDIIYNYSPDTPPQPGEIIRVSGVVDDEGYEVVRTNEIVTVVHWEPDMILVKRKSGEEVALDIDHAGELPVLFQAAKISRKPADWRIYYSRARRYVQIKSAFATTIHSSQGRTKENSLIILDNMLKCRSDNLAYVAVGRSRNIPWFVRDW
jgi:hypothetical protein